MSGNDLPVFEFDLDGITGNDDQEQETQSEAKSDEVTTESTKEIVEESNAETVDADQDIATKQVADEAVGDIAPEEAERYKSLYGFYKDEGIITVEDEFDGSKDKFAEILRKQAEHNEEQFKTQLIDAVPDQGQSIMEYLLTKGNNLEISELKKFLEIKEQAASIPVVDSEETAKSYLLKKYTKLHNNDKIANSLVETLEDEGILLETAKSEEVKDKEKATALEKSELEKAAQTEAKRKEQRVQFQQALNQELKNTKWKPDVQKEVLEEIFSQRMRQKASEIVKHPKALIKLANYLRFFNADSGDIDEEMYSKVAYSNAAKGLKDSIEKHFSRSDVFSGGTSQQKRKQDDATEYEFV